VPNESLAIQKKQSAPGTLQELIDEYHEERTLAYSSFQKHNNSRKRLAEYLGREPMVADPRTKYVNLEVSQDEDIRECDFL